MIKIIITGVCGKMGNTILNLALDDGDFDVVGVVEAQNHPLTGKPLNQILPKAPAQLSIEGNLANIIDKCDVIIDFTEPTVSYEYFKLATKNRKAVVIGTTGFSEKTLEEIKGSAACKIVISPNMSIGMNLMFDMVERLSRIMKTDYDIEITEMHHRMKKDAPSGTALKLKDIVKSSDNKKNWIEVYGRNGIVGERKKDELGVHALRGGDIVGEHTVMFAGFGERLEVTHRAYSRDNFAKGAIIAAKWLYKQGVGVYSMKDVLEI